MTSRTVESYGESHDYVRSLAIGLILAVSMGKGAKGITTASLDSACLAHSILSVFERDGIYVSPSFHPAVNPTLWLGSLAVDVTREEALDIQAFLDRTNPRTMGAS